MLFIELRYPVNRTTDNSYFYGPYDFTEKLINCELIKISNKSVKKKSHVNESSEKNIEPSQNYLLFAGPD